MNGPGAQLQLVSACLLVATATPTQPAQASFEPDGPSYSIRVPSPISRSDLAEYAQLLRLSDAQTLFCESLFDLDYLAGFKRIQADHVTQLRQLARGAGFRVDPETIEHAVAFLEGQERLVADVELHDGLFFARLASVLADEQRAAFDRVQSRRSRARTNPDYKELAGAEVDLSVVLRELNIDSTFDDPAFDAVMAEYERNLTGPFVAVDQVFREHGDDLLWYMLWQRFEDDGRPLERGSERWRERLREFGDKRRAVLRESLRFQQAIVALNEEYIVRLGERLTPDDFARLRNEYRHLTFPDVYPDRDEPTAVYAAVVSSKQLDDDVKQAIVTAWEDYHREHSAISTNMCDLLTKSMEDMAEYQGIRDHVVLREELRMLRDKRWALHERFLLYARGFLQENEPQLRPQIEAHLANLAMRRADAVTDSFPGW